MFILAYPEDFEQIVYFDSYGNKYIVKGGALAWRINNPGLVLSHSHVARRNGSIGAYGPFAIFATPEQGRKALSNWLCLKKYFYSTIKAIAMHYQPYDYEGFVLKLCGLAALPIGNKIKSYSSADFVFLKRALEKLCTFIAVGDEEQFLLPKIIGKIQYKGKEDSYLIGGNTVLSKTEAIKWIESHRLDASIIHGSNGNVHIRSRPGHSFWQLRGSPLTGNPLPDKPIATLVRTVGTYRPGQCIWGFINGISNTKVQALHSAEIISTIADGEAVISMPNDTARLLDLFACGALKCGMDMPIIVLAVHFLRYLLSIAQETDSSTPVIIFVHSQGAIICEHALELLSNSERAMLRIFSFGGGSFIARGKCHSDSHNYASAADLVCRLGSPHLQILALEDYTARKKGRGHEELIEDLATRDAYLQIDSLDPIVIQKYIRERIYYYEQEFIALSNITVLDPDPICSWQHGFENKCYQKVIQSIINKYQSMRK